MSAVSFLIALAGLSLGTYLMRFAGVKVGAAIATKGRRRTSSAASARGENTPSTASARGEQTPSAASAGADGHEASPAAGRGGSSGESAGPADSTERVTMWMDRATVVLIGAVFATTAVFDGKDIADPARLIGVGAGVLAAILRVPMLLSVVIGMAVCALIRTTGIL